MVKKNLKTMIITSIVILSPIIAGIILWDQLPSQIATHFNANGEPDGWSPKEFAVFGLPLLLLSVHWICATFTAQDPKYKNISDKMFHLLLWLCPVISIVGNGSTYLYVLDSSVDIVTIGMLFVGTVFIVIGNYMPKMKQSYTIGIKLPWTLNSEENWYRTHRFAGYVYMLGGVVVIISGFAQYPYVALLALFVFAFIPCIYSYVLYKKGI